MTICYDCVVASGAVPVHATRKKEAVVHSLGLLDVQGIHLGLLVAMVTVGLHQLEQRSIADAVSLGIWAHCHQ